MPTDEPDIIDLRPRIAIRKLRDCVHLHVVVDLEATEIECEDCGAELDPWWVLREHARRYEAEAAWRAEMTAHYEAKQSRIDLELAAKTAAANVVITRLNEQVAVLTNALNRLVNEQVNGRPLGAQVDKRKDKAR